jgi:hypothetical protein
MHCVQPCLAKINCDNDLTTVHIYKYYMFGLGFILSAHGSINKDCETRVSNLLLRKYIMMRCIWCVVVSYVYGINIFGGLVANQATSSAIHHLQ